MNILPGASTWCIHHGLERWGICVDGIRNARVLLEESFRYAHKRKTFGKRLIDHPVIRMKLAHMARQVESSQAWLESITYQMCKMDKQTAFTMLGGKCVSCFMYKHCCC